MYPLVFLQMKTVVFQQTSSYFLNQIHPFGVMVDNLAKNKKENKYSLAYYYFCTFQSQKII